MKQLIYISNSVNPLTHNQVTEMCYDFEVNNLTRNITGYLCYHKERFIQYIEGSNNTIDTLFKNLLKDSRHCVIFHCTKEAHINKLFSSWSMKFISKSQLQEFQIEHLIEKKLLFIKNGIGNKEIWEKILWRNVELISNTKPKIDHADEIS